MIINTGCRTDIPAFYSKWLMNRIREGYVLVRNPYNPINVTKYSLSPDVVDCLAFCTKNPEPMLKYMDELNVYKQYWFVTITPYGKDIEPNVPDKEKVIEGFKKLSKHIGINSIGWRYDPIFIGAGFNVNKHIECFEKMAKKLKGYTHDCTISFLDLYEKVKKNSPKLKTIRENCNCLMGNDIGAYNTCLHLCKYCYANYNKELVLENIRKHDDNSPFLIGSHVKEDNIKTAKQKSWKITNEQISLF